MAVATPLAGPNTGRRFTKTERVRLSDVAARTTTDYAEIIVGDGAPSGGYGADSGATLLYLRKDASSNAVAAYISYNGGTTWVALQTYSAALAALADGSADQEVFATVTVGNATGGATGAALTLQLKRRDNSTNIASARQVVIVAGGDQYKPYSDPAIAGSLTFGTATAGSIIASGAGWALVETNATGGFACTATNTDDETLYFAAMTATSSSDLTKACVVLGSNSDAAAWSA